MVLRPIYCCRETLLLLPAARMKPRCLFVGSGVQGHYSSTGSPVSHQRSRQELPVPVPAQYQRSCTTGDMSTELS